MVITAAKGDIATMSELIFKDSAERNYDLSTEGGINFAMKLYETQHVKNINCHTDPPIEDYVAIARANRKKKKLNLHKVVKSKIFKCIYVFILNYIIIYI